MKITNFIQFFKKKNKKIFYYLGFFAVVFLMSSDVTFAAEWESKVVDILIWFIKIAWTFLIILNYLIPLFLSPEWYNWSVFDMNTHFRDIWILVSNVVYFIFAFILIWIAFMNIIWKNADQYQLKQALPKFVVWVLIVPFSWFIVQFILSVAWVLTMSALTLPQDTFEDYKIQALEFPQSCKLDLTALWEQKVDQIIDCSQWWQSITDNSIASESILSIISTYTYWILNVWSIDEITSQLTSWDGGKQVKTILDLAIHTIFAVIIMIIYFILFITLALVLFVRAIYIWIYIMLSPVFWLMYFFDKKEWSWFFEKFNFKEFIALAMVPVYTMLALSFWLLFIYVTWQWLTQVSNDSSIKVLDKGQTLAIWDFKLEVTGSMWWVTDKNLIGFWEWLGQWVEGWLWAVWTLILKLFWIVILRWTIMAAMRASAITKQITEPIYQFGSKVWQIATSAPWNMPLFGWQSATWLQSAASSFKTSIDSHFTSKWAKLWEDISPFAKTATSDMKMINARNTSVTSQKQWEDFIREMWDKISDLDKTMRDPSSKKEFMEMIKKVFWEKAYDAVKDANTEVDFTQKFKSINPNDLSQIWKQVYDSNIKGRTETQITEFFEKWVENTRSSNSSWSSTNVDTWEINNWKMKVEIWGYNIWNLTVDANGIVTDGNNPRLVEKLKDLIVRNWKNKSDIDTIIQQIWFTDSAAEDLKNEIVKWLFYNETSNSYGVNATNNFKKVDKYDDIK